MAPCVPVRVFHTLPYRPPSRPTITFVCRHPLRSRSSDLLHDSNLPFLLHLLLDGRRVDGYGVTHYGRPSRLSPSLPRHVSWHSLCGRWLRRDPLGPPVPPTHLTFSVAPSYHAAPVRPGIAPPICVALDAAPWSSAALPMRDALDGTPPGRTLVLIHSAPSSYLRSALFII
jgi:hypothetical protein